MASNESPFALTSNPIETFCDDPGESFLNQEALNEMQYTLWSRSRDRDMTTSEHRDPFEFISLDEIKNFDSPIVYCITLDHVQDFAEDNCDFPLTDQEIPEFVDVIHQLDNCDLLYEAISLVRS